MHLMACVSRTFRVGREGSESLYPICVWSYLSTTIFRLDGPSRGDSMAVSVTYLALLMEPETRMLIS